MLCRVPAVTTRVKKVVQSFLSSFYYGVGNALLISGPNELTKWRAFRDSVSNHFKIIKPDESNLFFRILLLELKLKYIKAFFIIEFYSNP